MLKDAQIGGAHVVRGFTLGDKFRKAGEVLTAAEVLRIPASNRRAMSDQNKIAIFPAGAQSESIGSDRFVVQTAGGYDVVEGRKVNTELLTKAEARSLAGLAPQIPAAKASKTKTTRRGK